MRKILYLSFLGLIISCGTKETKKAENKLLQEIPTVELATVGLENLTSDITAAGVISSKSEKKLAFKTGGLIKNIYVSEGQTVKSGQLLAELDLSEINAGVNQAQIGLAKASRDFERVQKLFNENAATQTNLQDAQSGLDIAKQVVNAATFNQKLSKIYAPNGGVILKKLAETGELIAPFYPVFLLGSGDGTYMLNLGLTDKQIVKIKPGFTATVKIDAHPNEIFKAAVAQIAQTVNPATGTYEIELELAPTAKKLMSGFMATASISDKQYTPVLAVPVAALVEADLNMAFVFVYDASTKKVFKREIKIGKINGNFTEIISGLTAGEMVVVRGAGFLTDQMTVNIKK
jgi:RND family efflux transporter MFP subunit